MTDGRLLIRLLSTQIGLVGHEVWASAGPTLRELRLTGPLAELLWLLDPEEPARTMRELAATLVCDASNLTFLADRLEQRGLVVREAHPHDRRVRVLALTPDGRAARERLVSEALLDTPFNRLSRAEQETLHALLAKVLPSRPAHNGRVAQAATRPGGPAARTTSPSAVNRPSTEK